MTRFQRIQEQINAAGVPTSTDATVEVDLRGVTALVATYKGGDPVLDEEVG